MGHVALAQTNHGSINGALKHRKACQSQGIIPICGVEAYFRPDHTVRDKEWRYRRWHLVLLAKSLIGWHNLIRLTSAAFNEGFYQDPCVGWDLMERHGEGMICTTSCVLGPLPYLIENGTDAHVDEWVQRALKIYGSDLYFSIMPHDWDRQRAMNLEIVSIANRHGCPVVYEGDSHYPEEGWVETQKIAILAGWSKTFEEAETENRKRIAEGREVYELWHDDLHIMSEVEVRDRFQRFHPGLPQQVVDEAISNTDLLAASVEPYLMDKTIKMPKVAKTSGEARWRVLKWCRDGMDRIGKIGDPIYEERLRYEIEVIDGRRCWEYFALVGDVVRWARSDEALPSTPEDPTPPLKRPIRLNSGRGSAAASLVCYLTKITMVDPIAHKFKFERFINPERKGMPDIDMDIASSRRGEMQEYVVRKYGRECVCDIVAQQHWQPRAAVLTVAKTMYGFSSAAYQDAAVLTHEDTGVIDPVHDSDLESIRDREPRLAEWAERFPDCWEHAVRLENAGDPSVLRISKHAAAVAILPGPVTEFMPTIKANEEDVTPRSAWAETASLSVVDEIGIMKVDFLGLIGMDRQQMIVDLIAEYEGIDVDLDALPVLRDPYAVEEKVMDGFRQGLTRKVNQLGSDGIRDFLIRARPDNLVDLTAINALYRPGPLGSGGHNRYVKRKRGEEPVDLPDILKPVLDDTYSSICFQEQVMELFEVLVGYSAGQADGIRKIIAKLYRDKTGLAVTELDKHKETFIEGAAKLVGSEYAEKLWQEIMPYAAYCLTGDTIVTRGGRGRYDDTADITLSRLAENWRSLEPVGVKMRRQGIKLLAMSEDGRIRLAKARRVWSNGKKPVFRITTASGRVIKCTYNHRFLTEFGYRECQFLDDGDKLVVAGEKEVKEKTGPKTERAKGKSYVGREGGRGVPSGADNPAWVDGRNGMFEQAKSDVRIRANGFCEKCGRPDGGEKHDLEFAHQKSLDDCGGDYSIYHNADNIKHMCNSCHKTLDYAKGERKGRWSRGLPTELDEIVSIFYAGIEEVFDVEMESNEHNFVANGIISHNSFNRPHAGSYMIEAYQDMWLKAHYPLYTYSVMLTLDDKHSQLDLREGRRFGVAAMPPDVNISGGGFTVDRGVGAIRYGLGGVKGAGDAVSTQIEQQRPYTSLEDFEQRCSVKYSKVNKGAREKLIRAGALDSLGARADWTPRARAEAELELLGVALEPGGILGEHSDLVREHVYSEQECAALGKGAEVVVAGSVASVRQTVTKRGRNPGQSMAFVGLSLDLDAWSLVCFPEAWARTREILVAGSMVIVKGKLDERGQVIVSSAMELWEWVSQMQVSGTTA